jgi:hypothetical protein
MTQEIWQFPDHTLFNLPGYNDFTYKLLFRIVEAKWPQCRHCQALSYWGSGSWNKWGDWVKGGANGVSLQVT